MRPGHFSRGTVTRWAEERDERTVPATTDSVSLAVDRLTVVHGHGHDRSIFLRSVQASKPAFAKRRPTSEIPGDEKVLDIVNDEPQTIAFTTQVEAHTVSVETFDLWSPCEYSV